MGEDPSRWREIYSDLKRKICVGDMLPGTRLPSQQRLAGAYGASRHAVRRATAALEGDELLASWQGRGTFVAEKRFSYRIGPITRFGENMRLNGCVGDTEFIGTCRRPGPARVASMLGVSRRHRLHVAELLRRVDGRPAVLARHYYDPDRFPDMAESIRRTGSVTRAFSDQQVADYYRDRTVIETRAAMPTEAVLLEIPTSQSVLVMLGRNVDSAGQPVEVAEAVARGDRISLLIPGPDGVVQQ